MTDNQAPSVPPVEAQLRQLVAQWREQVRIDAKYGVSQALKSHREYFGSVNAALAVSQCAMDLEAAIEALHSADQSVEPEVRQGFWLNHGCSLATLYGDDGEMQCNACHIDFKREPLARICMLLFALGRLHAGALPHPQGWQPKRCEAEMCVCGHFQCKHDGALFRGVYTCDECECLGFKPVADPRGGPQELK